ncbi:DNA alkylation repair protein [Glutamicibacter sp. X7]
MNSRTELTPESTVAEVQAALADAADEKILAVNLKHGNNIAVNLGTVRAIAKSLKSNHELAGALWASKDPTTRLVAILICKPRLFTLEDLDRWLREEPTPKVQDWLLSYVVKKSKLLEQARQSWIADPTPEVASAGWELTAFQVAKAPDVLDLPALLDTIEAQMKHAPERLQWAMNNTLAAIGIEREPLRERAVRIGHELGVLADYPTPPGCTSPFAPVWIEEIVARRAAQQAG